MARSTRNDAQRQTVPKVEQGLRDLAEPAGCAEDPIVESRPALDILNLGHAGPRKECWSGANGTALGSSRSEVAATERLRAPRRRHTQLYHSRPPHRVEARFTPDNREVLTF